jgi:hypothetical protein
VGEYVFLKVKAKRGLIRLESFPKLAARYFIPFKILEKIWPVAYILVFPVFMRAYNVFHVSLLNKYVTNPNHIIDWTMI